jgi:RND superfamily putative drug exporter
MQDGIARIRDGIGRMRAGLAQAADGLNRSGANNDLADAAAAARDHAKEAFDELYSNALASSKADPAVQRATCHAGVTYGALTGRNPIDGSYTDEAEPSAAALCDAPPPSGNRSAVRRYADGGGLPGTLRTIAAGLREAIRGLDTIDTGLRKIDDGLAKLGPGLQEASAAVAKSIDGIRRMVDGLDQIIPGLGRLRAGLAEGAGRVRAAGFGDIASAGNLGLTPGLIESISGLRQRLSFFISSDERVTRLLVTFAAEPYHSRSLDAVEQIRRAGALALNKTPLQGHAVLVGGPSAFFDDIRNLSKADFDTIVMAVLLGIFVVLALLLRSLIAPTYLIFTVLLSFLSTLGLTVLVFQGILGTAGVPWWLPPFLFVLLVALGADYNIFLMSRIREESRTATTADATARGLALTGHVITSAGIILAGTFAALMFAPMKGLQQMGFATTAGILLDTFVVRSLLVPSIATLLGRHNWWPSSRAHAP